MSYDPPPERTAPLPPALHALDRLNRWARTSGEARPPRRTIYAMKDKALEACRALGLSTERFVYVDKMCGGCGGTGRYLHESGDRANNCWNCKSTGTQRLAFVETTIHLATDIVWHSPTDGRNAGYGKAAYSRAWGALNVWPEHSIPVPMEAATTWTVNLPGVPLLAAEAAELLGIAEAAFPLNGQYVEHWDERWGSGSGRPYYYDLDLGREGWPAVPACVFCGKSSVDLAPDRALCGAGATDRTRRIAWSSPICGHHGSEPGMWAKILELGPPAHILADHRIQSWILNHPPSPARE